MQQRLPSRLDPPIGFAHRGARAIAPENTLEAFRLALRLGATGLESDVWLTADGVPVLDHDGVVGKGRIRKRRIADTDRSDLPDWIPSVEDLLVEVGDGYHLSLDIKDPAAAIPTAEVIRAHGDGLAERTWFCDPDDERLIGLRSQLPDVRLVHSTRLNKLARTPEQHAARLASAGLDGMNMHRTDWSGGLVVLFHRFEVFAFGWDLQHEHHLENGLRMGLDAIYSDHVDVMMDVHGREVGG